MDFFERHGPMLNAFGNDVHFAGAKGDGLIPEFDIQLALEHEKEIIRVGVAVPDEFALGLHDHHIAVIVLGDGAGREVDTKFIVVTDDDVDIRDWKEVVWAITAD